MIKQFIDDYSWLSNFTNLEKPLIFQGIEYKTTENFYMAMKTKDKELRSHIAELTPGKAKRFCKTIELRDNWDQVKERVMLYTTRYKYSHNNPILRNKLLETGDSYIEEGNYHGDSYWGVCLVEEMGKNRLGEIIMQVREEIRRSLCY